MPDTEPSGATEEAKVTLSRHQPVCVSLRKDEDGRWHAECPVRGCGWSATKFTREGACRAAHFHEDQKLSARA